jgi:hypothetical protein
VCIVGGEVKRPAVMKEIGSDLVSKWQEGDRTTHQQVVSQLYSIHIMYMLAYGAHYGIITCLEYTWLVCK